jgi:branched-chain amino acid transport system ATP-binding protein
MTDVLRTENLGIAFGGLRAVDGVGLSAKANGITTVIGPNGAGKTTLFNLISGALMPGQGRVYLGGRDVTRLGPADLQRAGLARSFQITNLFFEMTVRENLRLAAQRLEPTRRMLRPPRMTDRAAQKVTALIDRFELGPKAHAQVGALSHGEQRRLEIAMCLASEPKVLMLDEPTQGMSHSDTEDTARMIRGLTEDVSVLLIEHDIGLVMEISDHVMVMHQGQNLAEGTPAEVRANTAVQAAYFGQE